MASNPLLSASLLAAALSLSAGCQNNRGPDRIAYVERPVEMLYNAASAELDSRAYEQAIQLFNEVERQHPYSEWARRSTLMTAYAHYRARQYDDAIGVAQRFIALHPGTDGAGYAYYIVAVSNFEQIIDVGRDQGTTVAARAALEDVVRRFPETDYARDARVKLDMVSDQLAGKEMEIGRWYLRKNQHLSAVNRFRTVVETYETTTHVPEALHRLVEVYMSMGLRGEAVAAAAVLGHNYPDTRWYRMSYNLVGGENGAQSILAEENGRSAAKVADAPKTSAQGSPDQLP
ncbi:MAG: outer membrane protein assembly factor BamD [Pseudomonadota bacterium]